jgi:hypothetical protein
MTTIRKVSRYPDRTKYGTMKQVVLFAQMNNMPASNVAKHFNVPVNSVYHACYRMGVRLKAVRINKGEAV